MKGGAILGKKELESKDHWTFGRHPRSDFVLEHPSASRLHAVLQFRGTDAQGFVYDAGSAHGSFLNKQRLPAREHTPIRLDSKLSPSIEHAEHIESEQPSAGRSYVMHPVTICLQLL